MANGRAAPMSSASIPVPSTSINRRILNAASAVALAALVVKLAATVKEFAVAGIYGRSDELEAFLIAALIPGLLINIVSESMNQALIPTLVRVRTSEGRERAQQLLSNSLVGICLLLVLASIGMALSARFVFPLIGSHFAPGKLDLAVHLFYGLLPVIVLTGIASLSTAVLGTAGSFALPALAPIVTPLAIMVAVPLFASRFGIWTMVYATVAGALLHAIWTGTMMNASGYRAHAAMVWNVRSHLGSRATVRAGVSERAGRIGRTSRRSVHGGDASGGKRLRTGVCRPFRECGAGDAGRSLFLCCNSVLFGTGGARRLERMSANTAHLGLVVGVYRNDCCCRDHIRSAGTRTRDLRAWRVRAARHLRGFVCPGHVRSADSVFRLQPRLLSVPGGDAPHRSCLLLRAVESCIGRCSELAADATVRRSRHRAGNIALEREYA